LAFSENSLGLDEWQDGIHSSLDIGCNSVQSSIGQGCGQGQDVPGAIRQLHVGHAGEVACAAVVEALEEALEGLGECPGFCPIQQDCLDGDFVEHPHDPS